MKNPVIDVSRDNRTGEITQFTVIDESGEPDIKKATPENILLYDPEDDLPFENGLSGFMQGSSALKLQEDPLLLVAPTNDDYCYLIRYQDKTVETTPNQSENVLRGIKDAVINNDTSILRDVYDTIVSEQVRRPVIRALMQTFDESHRLSESNRGWFVDDFYLVNWEASMYVKHDDPDEADYARAGNSVQEIDRSHEFVELRFDRQINPIEVTIGDETVRLSEREMLFLTKIKWLLNRREMHADMEFWFNADQYADVDWRTGQPTEDEADEPDLSGV